MREERFRSLVVLTVICFLNENTKQIRSRICSIEVGNGIKCHRESGGSQPGAMKADLLFFLLLKSSFYLYFAPNSALSADVLHQDVILEVSKVNS